VPAGAVHAQPLKFPTTHHSHGEPIAEEESPYVMLLVPSATIVAQSNVPMPAGSGWVELGCRLESARFINDAKFSIA
jgi:hypothetical protein